MNDKRVRCIIVEDEPLAQDVIETYLKNFESIEQAGKFGNAVQAFQYLQKNKVDLMFLDIKMPGLSGIDFLKALSSPPKVIITTAFRDYAIEGFDLNVVDYLLKPISFERFLKAIDKYFASTLQQVHSADTTAAQDKFIYVHSNRKQIKINLSDIKYIESEKDYSIFHTIGEKVITKNTISHFEEVLPKEMFLRIHRSYIAAIGHISSVTKSSIEIGKKELPVGRQYKKQVNQILGADI